MDSSAIAAASNANVAEERNPNVDTAYGGCDYASLTTDNSSTAGG